MSFINEAYVLQVGDRLVTRRWRMPRGGGRYQPFDELANKCVIYCATDAIAFISYSGIAFVQHRPTDVWLAETLDPDIAAGPHSALRIGGSTERRITIGAAMNRVATRLTEALRTMPALQRGDGLTLQLVGWKWRRRRMFEMPIMWRITNPGHGGQTTIHRLPRYWGWERHQSHAAAIGNRRTNPTHRFQLRIAGLTYLPADLAEQLLVETIREASADRSTGGSIGADCISTLLQLSDAKARVRYLPASPSHATYDAYSPWVVVPGVGASAPSVLTGGLPSIHLGGLEVAFERAASPSAPVLPIGMGSLPRPRAP